MNFEAIKRALSEALSKLGVTEYEVYFSTSRELTVATLNKEVNSFTSGLGGGLCLRVLVDGKMGYASTELMTEDEMVALSYKAVENARATDKLDVVGIFGGSDSYLESTVPPYMPKTAGELRLAAQKIADAMYQASDKIQPGTTSQAFSAGYTVRIFNSHGLDLNNTTGVNALLAEAVVKDGSESSDDYSMEEFLGDVDTLSGRMAEDAIGSALDKIGAKTAATGKYNIVISGKTMRSLLSAFSGSFSAKRVLDGMSLLKGKIGEKIASDIVTVTDDPMREGSPVGTTFDAEGVATSRKAVVENGVLKTYLHNRETAAKMGAVSTANASKSDYSSPIGIRPHSFFIEPGDKTEAELFDMAHTGIYVTGLKGLHAGVNDVTGDYSLEAEGFMIREGKKAEAVKNFTVSGNFFDTLKNIAALSDKAERGVPMGTTSFGSPAVLIKDVSIAGS